MVGGGGNVRRQVFDGGADGKTQFSTPGGPTSSQRTGFTRHQPNTIVSQISVLTRRRPLDILCTP